MHYLNCQRVACECSTLTRLARVYFSSCIPVNMSLLGIKSMMMLCHLMQVYKVYARYLTGIIGWWKPPPGTVFNIALFTGWEEALIKHIPPGWQRLKFQATIKFMKWLTPRPGLFKWLNVSLSCILFVHVCSYIRSLGRPMLAFSRAWHNGGDNYNELMFVVLSLVCFCVIAGTWGARPRLHLEPQGGLGDCSEVGGHHSRNDGQSACTDKVP